MALSGEGPTTYTHEYSARKLTLAVKSFQKLVISEMAQVVGRWQKK